jgi:serine/threonine-protein kinase
LYELLTGRAPFRAESSTATLQQLLSHEPVSPARLNPRVPRDLETICLKCLQKEPAKRYASAAALADDLRRFQRNEPIVARRIGWTGRLVRWSRRHPAGAALAASLALAAALAVSLGLLEFGNRQQRRMVERAVREDLHEVAQLEAQGAWARADAVVDRARGRSARSAQETA